MLLRSPALKLAVVFESLEGAKVSRLRRRYCKIIPMMSASVATVSALARFMGSTDIFTAATLKPLHEPTGLCRLESAAPLEVQATSTRRQTFRRSCGMPAEIPVFEDCAQALTTT